MGIIHVLPEHIANRIAAGEVIERPASIVKELVENSLDAGAKSIDISVRHGGKSLIRVADDGSGMSPEDAELAFQRHATSKIASADDLFQIASFGFRGEALPSIAAVSRLKITTRVAKNPTGTEIQIEGGKMTAAKECAARPGTIIEVRDLFFNTPARRKFLKADTTEGGHILDMVSNLALSHLDVGFKLEISEKVVLNLLPGESLKARAAAILGEETAKQLLEVDWKGKGMRFWGLIGKPQLTRSNRTGQTFFINKRWVKSISLGYGVLAGYHGLLMHGQFPVSVLFVEVDLNKVDVNVHPTKQEVRISNETEIKGLLQQMVEERLTQEGDLVPDMKKPAAGGMPSFLSPSSGFSKPSFDSGWGSSAPSGAGAPAAPVFAGLAESDADYTVHASVPLEENISLRNKLHITKVLGQIHHTFLVAETTEGLMLIDQHAAHERVMFEVMRRDLEKGHASKQKLLMEEVIEVAPKHKATLIKAIPLLEKIGFEIEAFGGNSFVIRAVPAILDQENPAALIKGYLEEKEDGKIKTSLEGRQEELAALIACKRKSVKAYQLLSPLQIKTLLERLADCEHPFSCPHGRPAILKYSFLDLEKQFKRK